MKNTIMLNQNYLFRRMYRQGKCVVNPYVAVYQKNNHLPYNRLGITATKKIGNSVQRNRARRVIKEAYRLLEPSLKIGFDYVIVARKKSITCNMQSVQNVLKDTLLFSS